jgi:branched-chain amino acid transport system ATP-binding protein
MLSLREVRAGYGGGQVLHGVNLDVPTGTVTALIGPNGAGKTTLVHAIAGLLPVAEGSITLRGTVLSGRSAHRVARAGVGLVPQGRRVFASLTVAEHLRLAGAGRVPARPAALPPHPARERHRVWDTARVLGLFPRLRERLRHRGSQLSGGEQQMLAIARALLRQPRLLLLDEPCEGLAPDLAARIRGLVTELAGAGMTVLLVEQGLDVVLDIATEIAVLHHGRLAMVADAATVRADPAMALIDHSGRTPREER